MVERYIFSGSLPEDATTYVTREADTQLYEGLKAGKYCYVLNSRQTGKSSLRVRTMRRLREEGFSCVAINLALGGIQNVTPQKWYADMLDTLIEHLALDVDLEEWWFEHKSLSSLKRFGKLIEEVLLVEVRENIVIFIDEIDSVLSLKFPTDDFFAFIRACYNQRADNPEYKRLSFCLLGVASPSELIADKKRTPFNIGQAIFLKGFQWQEVEPLKRGLQGKVGDPTAMMKEILEWTGGQPFLTQKLCQFVVEESDREEPRSVEEIVKARIIANWESQDEPEHLKTIRDRLLSRDQQRVGYLLELYQQIRQQREISLNDSLEQSELQLSGLVVKRQGKLLVTNPIYREVFNQKWIDEQLASLRPYSENFRAWLASECKDKSRLFVGKALSEAEEWGKNKNLSYQDREFLAASVEAQTKIRLRRVFSLVIGVAVIFSFSLVLIARQEVKEAKTELEEIEDANDLAELSGKLDQAGKSGQASQARERIGLFFEMKEKSEDHQLQQALLSTSLSLAYQNLGRYNEAEEEITNSLNLLEEKRKSDIPTDQLVVFLDALNTEGELFKIQKDIQKAVSSYEKAFELLQATNSEPIVINNPSLKTLARENIVRVYKGLMESLLLQSYINNITEFNKQNFERAIERAIQLFEALQLTKLSNFSQKDNSIQIASLNKNLVQIHKIDSTAAVIYTFLFSDRIGLIVQLPRHRFILYMVDVTEKTVKETLTRIQVDLLRRESDIDTYTRLNQVYDWLIRPLEPELARSGVETLVFVPDEHFQRIPIAALFDGKQYLIERYGVAVIPGLQILQPQHTSKKTIKVLIGALSQEIKIEGRKFGALPNVQEELNTIESLVPSQVLLNEKFTREALEERIQFSNFPVVHLATHGRFSPDAEDTFIVTENKLIDADDLSDLLKSGSSIELLVLSASETALGDKQNPSGIAGISILSGVPSVLATLWKIEDETASYFMGQFYTGLEQGLTKVEALRQAQLYMLQNSPYDQPIYWAGYVLIGNWL